MDYFEALYRAIHRKIAPDMRTALMHCDKTALMTATHREIKIPLLADVSVAWDNGCADFIIQGKVFDEKNNQYYHVESIFSSREISRAHDKAAIIEHLFDEVKRTFLIKIAEGKLEELLKGKPDVHNRR